MSTRLLIVDDHANAREMIRKFVALPGMTVRECATGTEAVAVAREFKPHWVTMDVVLPGQSGFDCVKTIKADQPDTRVMIISAYNEPHFHKMARASGAVGFILKENILAFRLLLEREHSQNQPPLNLQGN